MKSDSNNISLYLIFIFCQFYAIVSDYRHAPNGNMGRWIKLVLKYLVCEIYIEIFVEYPLNTWEFEHTIPVHIDSVHFWNTDAACFETILKFVCFFHITGTGIYVQQSSIYLDIAILIFIWTSGIWLDRIFELIDYFIYKDIYSFKFKLI